MVIDSLGDGHAFPWTQKEVLMLGLVMGMLSLEHRKKFWCWVWWWACFPLNTERSFDVGSDDGHAFPWTQKEVLMLGLVMGMLSLEHRKKFWCWVWWWACFPLNTERSFDVGSGDGHAFPWTQKEVLMLGLMMGMLSLEHRKQFWCWVWWWACFPLNTERSFDVGSGDEHALTTERMVLTPSLPQPVSFLG